MKKIGLTGGMGSGKSSVAKILEGFGCIIVDADHIARLVRKPGTEGHNAILNRFQTDDRLELRRILSTSPEAKKDLEAILHPLIQTESDRFIKEAISLKPSAPALFYEATLLIEAGRTKDFDALLVVTAPEADRIRRVALRDKISEKDAELIIHAQNSDEFRLRHAQYQIDNTTTENELKIRVRKVLDQIISA